MERLIFPLSIKEAEKKEVGYSSTDNYNARFPTRLRELHKNAETTQQKIADAVGVTKSSIGLYETGDSVPDAKTIYNLAKYYNVSTDYLLCLSDVGTTDTDVKAVYEYTGLSERTIMRLHDAIPKKPTEWILQLLINCLAESESWPQIQWRIGHMFALGGIAKDTDVSSLAIQFPYELDQEVAEKSHGFYQIQPIDERIEQQYSIIVDELGSIINELTDCNAAIEIGRKKWTEWLNMSVSRITQNKGDDSNA